MTKPLITWWLEKKVVKWQKFKSALCNLTQKLLLLNFVSMQFWTEISNQSGSQIHAWILLKKKLYFIRIYSIFCRASPFHHEWLPLINILMIETFSQKANQNLSRLDQLRPFTVKRTCPAKNRVNSDIIEIFFKRIHAWIWLPDWFEISVQNCMLTKFNRSSFFVKSQSAVLNFCHLTTFFPDHHVISCFAKETKKLIFLSNHHGKSTE